MTDEEGVTRAEIESLKTLIKNRLTPGTHLCAQSNEISTLLQNQETIKTQNKGLQETIKTQNQSLTRIFQLYEKMDQRLDKGEKRFKNIDQYIATRTISNGHNNKTLTQLQKTVTTVEDRLDQHDIQLNTLQTILTQLQKSLQTIQDLLKGITIGAIVGLILYFINTIR